ncbi:MAG: TIGR04282 family arsenosugar biosynthesis glycosyltransferase [Melioribacteraceae bacterium]|nr:TIGR04282 family arsenosugar biosynthesis glycosyltransferase [Melioribacteraceae bacterium]
MASTASNKFAAGVYRILSKNIFDQLVKVKNECDVHLFYAPFDSLDKIKDWVDQEFIYQEQTGIDLGDRIANAFEYVFQKNYKSVIIIGSDVPEIDNLTLCKSFNLLENYDIVIAPADDGGYSLLGMNKQHRFLFENIEWSTDSVFTSTKNKALKNNLNLKVMSPLNDIDTLDELVTWMNKSKNIKMVKEIKKLAEKENIIL